jgi:putative flippase GtrA
VTEHETVRQFVRYATVGVFNVACFFALFNAFLKVGLHDLASYALAFGATSIVSFVLNKRWAFRDVRRGSVMRQYFLFLFFTAVGLGLNTTLFYLFLIPLRAHGTLGKNFAAMSAIPFSVAWNFTAYRLWTFKTHAVLRPGSGGA